jgi:hypothetical protein
MSIYKLNIILKEYKFSALLLNLILISSFIVPIINSSGSENPSQNSLFFQNNFINEDVPPIIGKSNSFSLANLNGKEQINQKETELIIEKNILFNRNELKYYINLYLTLAYLELPDLINFIPRSPPTILS